ncbi:unnamed protein product [Prunus brigantina]
MKPLLKNNDVPKDGRKVNIPKASTTQRTKSNFENLLPFLFSLLLFFFLFWVNLCRSGTNVRVSSSVAAENNR